MRLAVALSFVGLYRDRVRPVAEELAEIYGKNEVFFDEWGDLARLDGGQQLEAMYREAQLMVVFLSPEYGQEEERQLWTRLEWDEVYRRHKDRKSDRVHLFQIGLAPKDLDGLKLPGLSSVAFPTAVEGRSASELVEHIVHRLDRLGVPRGIGPGSPSKEVLLEAYRQKALYRYGRVSMVGVSIEQLVLGMDDIYVPLDLRFEAWEMTLGGKRRALRMPEEVRSIGIEEVFAHVEDGDVPTIMGEAGSGKTTALQKLLHVVLTQGARAAHLPKGTVPVWLRAAELKRFSAEDHPFEGLLEHAVDETFRVAIFDGRPLLLLFDGVDELADPRQRVWALELLDRALEGPKRRAVVSCRHSARGDEVTFPDRFRRFGVIPLDDEQRRALSLKWFTGTFRTMRAENPAAQAETETDKLFSRLGEVFRLDAHHRTLVSTPLFATLQCALHLVDETLPTDSATFLRRALELLLDRREKYGAEKKPKEAKAESLCSVLEDVALRIQEQARQDGLTREEWADWVWQAVKAEIPPKDEEAWRAWLKDHLDGDGLLAGALVGWLHTGADVLSELDESLIFRHRGFQEVLAAARLVAKKRRGLQVLASEANGQTWREPFLYAVRILGKDRFPELARLVLRRTDLSDLVDVLREAVELVPTADVSPFIEVLRSGPDEAREAILDIFGRTNDAILEVAAQEVLPLAQSDSLLEKLRVLVGIIVERVPADDRSGPPRVDRALERRIESALLRVLSPERYARLNQLRMPLGALIDRLNLGGSKADDVREVTLTLLRDSGAEGHRRLNKLLTELAEDHPDPETTRELASLGQALLGPKEASKTVPVDGNERRPEVGSASTGVASALGKPFVEKTTGMRFLWVPGGVFEMGAEDMSEDEKPVHRVRVSSFWLGETTVTNAQYRAFVEATERPPPLWTNRKYNAPEQPVVGLPWKDAVAYCAWFQALLKGQLEATARLPSEAWWERAARGDDARRYPWGDEAPNEQRAWYGQPDANPKPVGQYPEGIGPYGHLDLAGNVWEWCSDIWDAQAYRKPPHSDAEPFDPEVTGSDQAQRVVRGGGFWNAPDRLQAAYRGWHVADRRDQRQGFRVCLSPPSTGGSGGRAP